ncbi:putative Pre-mRNA polyadenylation factor FIP1 [Sclerotinia borealis F-4128]|uniref:Putative Pre-mRNA polyadenylation factor FIP1 n=1 Tax=Sclerotinia borealis (strain F-4128) TaxID=1432307 RepID=W9CCP9_SCLBF|nr:putative Pre-mRNA polyadenylation factor FIP1 [Sclerotinia borealis F-4128]
MDIDEDDDFYAPEDSAPPTLDQVTPAQAAQSDVKSEQQDEDLEEGEEEDEGDDSDSDIDIITERKDGAAAPPPTKVKSSDNDTGIPSHTKPTIEADARSPVVRTKKPKKSSQSPAVSAVELPGLAISKIDVNAKPMYEPAGKPITQINIDEDLNENDKPWRRPGTDISDYFNYGFDEFTWALYASKQESLRSEFDPNKIAQNQKKMFEDMNMMMAMGGGPMSGMQAAPAMEGMTPEMVQQMQQMIANGIDPSQMDTSMFGGSGSAGGGAGGYGGGGQFGGGGYDQGMMGAGGESNRGGGFGRGRGRRGRGNW